MILGHVTNTFMLHSLWGKYSGKKAFAFAPLVAGALMPDILDKGIMLASHGEYPGRGIFHSVIILPVVFYPLIRLTGKHRQIVLTFFAGTLLHLVQDIPDKETLFWPLLGPWNVYYYPPLLEKVREFYIDMKSFCLWTAEVISFLYCLGYIVNIYMRRATLEKETAAGKTHIGRVEAQEQNL